jgi:hypothetical protein
MLTYRAPQHRVADDTDGATGAAAEATAHRAFGWGQAILMLCACFDPGSTGRSGQGCPVQGRDQKPRCVYSDPVSLGASLSARLAGPQ